MTRRSAAAAAVVLRFAQALASSCGARAELGPEGPADAGATGGAGGAPSDAALYDGPPRQCAAAGVRLCTAGGGAGTARGVALSTRRTSGGEITLDAARRAWWSAKGQPRRTPMRAPPPPGICQAH